jgi:predicted naringenin-chalcone synthase
MIISQFHSLKPPFETLQKDTLDWLLAAHCQAEKVKGKSEEELISFHQALKEKIWHVGCKPDLPEQRGIEKRGHVLKDFLHENWEAMEIYNLSHSPHGQSLSARSECFAKIVDSIFETYYPENTSPPQNLIHVSCTGYVAPSGAQKIVSKRNWGGQTTVTHAYHMGCYGALAGIRIGLGLAPTDIVHTEICTLHSNPSLHHLDQLVSQSLFADGFIKYTLSQTNSLPHLKILGLLEEILPDSTHAMSWNLADWGFQMSLSRELPVLITRALKEYLKRLAAKCHISYESLVKDSLFAVHPGGPKILTYIQDLLNLSDSQMHYSFEILKNFGNMSSATLPHVWQKILEDSNVSDKIQIVSLAFGPGLTISGAMMVKSCGS